MKTFTRIAFVALLTLTVSAAVATAQPPDPNKPQFGLGVAVISSPEPYKGTSNETLVVPNISFAYKRFYLRGIIVGFQLFENDAIELDLVARPRFGGYDADDSRFLEGMEDRRDSADAGFEISWEREHFGLQLTAVSDVLGRYDGQEVTFEVKAPLQRGPFRIEPRAGVVWQSADHVDYFYGVRPDEARPDRPAYEPGDSLNLTAGVFTFAPVTRRIVFQGFARVDRFGSEIKDSPIVDQDYGWIGFAGLSYQF
jgi:outer membrane protein